MFIFESPTASKHFCLLRMTTGSSWQLPISCSKEEMIAKEKWQREGVHKRRHSTTDVAEGVWQRQYATEKRGLFLLVLTDFYIQPCFSIREANKNKCVSIYYIHKYTESHTKQTVDISHHACHNLAWQIVGIKWSQSVRCQAQAVKSVVICVINKDRWFKQVRKMLT